MDLSFTNKQGTGVGATLDIMYKGKKIGLLQCGPKHLSKELEWRLCGDEEMYTPFKNASPCPLLELAHMADALHPYG